MINSPFYRLPKYSKYGISLNYINMYEYIFYFFLKSNRAYLLKRGNNLEKQRKSKKRTFHFVRTVSRERQLTISDDSHRNCPLCDSLTKEKYLTFFAMNKSSFYQQNNRESPKYRLKAVFRPGSNKFITPKNNSLSRRSVNRN